MEENNAYDQSDSKNSIYDKIHAELKKYFTIEYNEISLEFEIHNTKTGEVIPFNKASLLIHLNREKFKVNSQILKTYFKSHFVPQFNPIIEYFESLPQWDGKDYIKQYSSYVKTDDDELFYHHLKKWTVRAIKSVFHSNQINKHSLILANGAQHAGKSTYLKNICPEPLMKYYYENIGISKDDRIKLCKGFIVNMEELDILGKYDVNSIKSLISQMTVNERLPYAEKATLLYRICSFLGSTNKTEFLTDDTGSVRFIVFNVIGRINFDYSKEFDIANFWAQAYHIYLHQPDFKSDLTVEELEENERRNEQFTVQTVESEFVIRFYEKTDDLDYFRTASDVETELAPMGKKLNIQRLGSTLKKYGFERIKHPKKQVYGYKAKPKFKHSPLDFKD